MTTTVRQILEGKGYNIHSVSPDDLVIDAIRLMAEAKVGALLVMDDGKVAGIISERDYTRKVILNNRSSQTTRVRDIMTSNVIAVRPEQNIEDCMVVMSKHQVRHLPVLEGDKAVGMLSVMDVVKSILSEKEFIIEQLENYIAGVG
ncbi:MAG: CBS domain-containing protein [Gammaproteobacteria bacterium]|nr:CBS domain-containing protein [Gammaproteobacteria bacterium]